MPHAERHDFAVEIAAKLRNVGIIGVQDGDAARRQRRYQFIFRARHIGQAAEKFHVHRAHQRDYADLRLRDLCQRGDLAGMRHAHLDHSDVVLALQAQQLQRQAEVIVEIAFRLQDAKFSAQNLRDGFLGSGFASRASHANERLAPNAAYCRAQGLQGWQSLPDDQQTTSAGEAADLIGGYYRAGCALRQSGFNKIMAIQPLAAYGKKKLVPPDRARVNGVSRHQLVTVEIAAGADEFGNPPQWQSHGRAPPARAP